MYNRYNFRAFTKTKSSHSRSHLVRIVDVTVGCPDYLFQNPVQNYCFFRKLVGRN